MTDETITNRLYASPAADQWKIIGIRDHHGIALPLFSLRSSTSCGIGEYPDLNPMIDWCHEVGMDVIQLLPLNDNGHETSPYSALSAYALNPIHLGLARLPHLMENNGLAAEAKKLQSLTTASQRIDYQKIHPPREKLLKEYYSLYGPAVEASNDYRLFLKNNASWLNTYSRFKALKNKFNWKSWEEWPINYRSPTGFADDLSKEADYHSFVQYLCFAQFNEVKQHAENKGVHLKGDIPILINRDSADVWEYRKSFNLDLAAGAPPDMYAKEGQKWGFPLYNWDVLEKDHYKWWTDRLSLASKCYHLYRIDHVVGFFRIWGIPLDLPAKDGYFVPKDERTWIPQGEQLMRMMLKSCMMLPIGEDLGTVPPEVRVCLKNLGICGTKVMRWERFWHGDQSFIPPADYPAESMTTVSTHDSETLAQWWRNHPDEARLYGGPKGWSYTPDLTHEQRLAILRSSHRSGSLFHINLLQEYLALIPEMTWPKEEDERINIPGLISGRNWSYRFKPSIEEIVSNPSLKQKMSEILRP